MLEEDCEQGGYAQMKQKEEEGQVWGLAGPWEQREHYQLLSTLVWEDE